MVNPDEDVADGVDVQGGILSGSAVEISYIVNEVLAFSQKWKLWAVS